MHAGAVAGGAAAQQGAGGGHMRVLLVPAAARLVRGEAGRGEVHRGGPGYTSSAYSGAGGVGPGAHYSEVRGRCAGLREVCQVASAGAGVL